VFDREDPVVGRLQTINLVFRKLFLRVIPATNHVCGTVRICFFLPTRSAMIQWVARMPSDNFVTLSLLAGDDKMARQLSPACASTGSHILLVALRLRETASGNQTIELRFSSRDAPARKAPPWLVPAVRFVDIRSRPEGRRSFPFPGCWAERLGERAHRSATVPRVIRFSAG
jgi:hypothetical protein